MVDLHGFYYNNDSNGNRLTLFGGSERWGGGEGEVVGRDPHCALCSAGILQSHSNHIAIT